jgi:hypothetical protein
VAVRRLDDGSEFTIVKVFYSPAELTAALADVGVPRRGGADHRSLLPAGERDR